MENNNEIKFGLWIKESKTGTKYLSGQVEIEWIKYFVSCFKQGEKKNEKQPDYNVILKVADDKYQPATKANNPF